jgi:hypothetical protein
LARFTSFGNENARERLKSLIGLCGQAGLDWIKPVVETISELVSEARADLSYS